MRRIYLTIFAIFLFLTTAYAQQAEEAKRLVTENAAKLAEVGVDALHFSAKCMVSGAMEYRNPRISMGGSAAVDEFSLRTVDEQEVEKILTLIKR